MTSETGRVQLDAWAVFWKVTFVILFILEILALRHLLWVPFRRPLQRVMILLFDPRFTRRFVLISLILGGLITLLGVVLVRVILRPAVEYWLRPQVDPSVGSFHMAAGERILAGVPARKRGGRSWQAGSLVLTDAVSGSSPNPGRWSRGRRPGPRSTGSRPSRRRSPAGCPSGIGPIASSPRRGPGGGISWQSPIRPRSRPGFQPPPRRRNDLKPFLSNDLNSISKEL